MDFTNEIRHAVRSGKVLTADKNRNVLRRIETEDNIAKLATVGFINHVIFVCHYSYLPRRGHSRHKQLAMSSREVPRLGLRSCHPKPKPRMVLESLDFVS